jgi:AsmA protein
MKKVLRNVLKYTSITLVSLLSLLFLLPILFPGTVAEQIKKWTNRHIEGNLNFTSVRLSFFEHFPTLTLTLYDFSLNGSAPFAQDTLLAGKALSFGLDLGSVFRETLEVSTFYLDKARINVQVDEKGQANYNIYKGTPDSTQTAPDSSNTKLRIQGIFINQCHLTYNDRSLPMMINSTDFNYEGRGDLANSQFDLQSKIRAEGFDFVYGGTAYFQHRKLKADLITGINTSSLVFRFAKNDLLINKLPVDFSGQMAILKDGYDIDVNVVSGTTDFGNVFSALPPEYDKWFAGTQFSGLSQIKVAMKGQYRAATKIAPDLSMSLWVHDGSIRSDKAPEHLQHLWVKAVVKVPGLVPDNLSLSVDTLKFDLGGSPTTATLYTKGINKPHIKANIQSNMDLGLLDRAMGLSDVEMRGKLKLLMNAEGTYDAAQNPHSKHPETIIASIPAFHLEAGIENGYFKTTGYEVPIEALQAQIRSDCTTGKWQDISLAIDQLHAGIGNGEVAGHVTVKGLTKSAVNAQIKANLQLEDLARAMPTAGYTVGGALLADIRAEGILDAAKHLFPSATGTLQLKNGLLQTPYYPHPLEQLQINASLQDKGGHYSDLAVQVHPMSFLFEKQPFTLDADVQNPDDPRYKITANGTLDLEKIYQVFALEGYAISGLLKANFSAQGNAADARAGRYDRLLNSGTLQLQHIRLHSHDYPDPFYIPRTTLRFDQDKAWLENSLLTYRKNEFTLNGYAQNIIGYMMQNSPLQGKLTVSSPKVVVDDFMAFSKPEQKNALPAASTPAAPAQGVVLLPTDMDLTLDVAAKEILYGQTRMQDFSGQVTLRKGQIQMPKTQLGIAGATISLSGNYTPQSARKAVFEVDFKADSFDVHRAYEEVPMFREMATSAASASGMVSLQYHVEGRLNDRMEPVYPSIKGKGFIKLEQVKVKGLKLFGAVSKATGKEGINDPDLKSVVIKSTIANNLITIERTKMKVLGFRPRIEGQTSLDGRLNIRFRLGLPPLGLFGIPMTITGTSDNPVVEMRKGKEGDALDEEKDEEDN